MVKKEWVNPGFVNLGVEHTEAGGTKPTDHDGNIYQLPNGLYVEEYKS